MADQAEVYQAVTQSTPVSFEANKLKLLQTRESSGVALRIIKDGRIGFASTSDLQDPQRLVDTAVEMAVFGAKAHLEFPSRRTYPSVDVYDPNVETFPVDDMVHLGQGLIDDVRRDYPDVQCDSRVFKSVSTQTIMNSRGGHISYTASTFGISLNATLIQGEDMVFVWDGEFFCRPIRDTAALRDSVKGHLALAKKVVPSVSGSLPVVFTPQGVSAALMGPLLSAFSGRTVLEGTSPLVGRLGERIVSESLSVWDDPTIPYIPASSRADDEGVPRRRKAVIDHGVAATFLYDLQTAGEARTTSTGNASRMALGAHPTPAASVLVIDQGNVAYQDMIKDMKEGLVVVELLGAGQGNELAGEFNANVLLGYRVQNGEITGRVKDTMISGNVYDVLGSLVAIGSESRWLGGRMKTPAIYCSGVSVSAKK